MREGLTSPRGNTIVAVPMRDTRHAAQQPDASAEPAPEPGDQEAIADMAWLPQAVAGGWTREELFGLCMVEYPRWLHSVEPRARKRMLSKRPELTDTIWDAAIGASMEHGALIHDETPPDWVEEPERFLTSPVELLPQASPAVVCHLPAPFTRRGIVMDPRNLDRRTGDEQWSPDPGDTEHRWPRKLRHPRNAGEEYLARMNNILYEQRTATRVDTENPSLHNGCAGIESSAADEGWVVRIRVSPTHEPETFVLRGVAWTNGRINALGREASRKLIDRGLKNAGLNKQQWEELLKTAANAQPRNRTPAPTIWNRPALTIAGTASGIREQWRQAQTQAQES